MFEPLMIQFGVFMIIITGVIIFALHRIMVTSTEGALKRLDAEIQKANQKQVELNAKIKKADEELAQRQREARELATKMRTEAEEETKAEREKIVSKAREEGEEIIAKAQGNKDKLRLELEKEVDIKAADFGARILNDILSEKAKGSLDQILINEFLSKLRETDMSRISPDINTADLISLTDLDDSTKNQFSTVIKEKLNRDVSLNPSTDKDLAGGVVLKFGSMALDGSIRSLIRESFVALQGEVEAKKG